MRRATAAPPPGAGPRGRALDLGLLGLLLVGGFALRVLLAQRWIPDPVFAIGSDADDWAGVFQGAALGWPLDWDGEWAHRYPLLPGLAWALARLLALPLPLTALWINLLVGSAAGPLTYLLGRPLVGRPAALAAAGWMTCHHELVVHSATTTAYGLVVPLYLLLLLGLIWSLRGRVWGGALLAALGGGLTSYALLHGVWLVGTLVAAALVALAFDLARTPRPWRRLPAVVLPGPIAALVAVEGARLSRAWHPGGGRHVLAYLQVELRTTLLHDPRLGNPMGHRVERLLAGVSRWEHFLLSFRELFGVPVWVALPVLAAGIVALVLLARRGPRAPFVLLALLLGGLAYGLLANSEEFHIFQWYPPFALVIGAGLAAWQRLWSGRWARRFAWIGAAALLAWQCLAVPLREARTRTGAGDQLAHYVREARQGWRLFAEIGGPVARGGTLLIGDWRAWNERGYAARVDRLRWVDLGKEEAPLAPLERPVYLASQRPVGALPPAWARWGRWAPVAGPLPPGEVVLHRLIEPPEP